MNPSFSLVPDSSVFECREGHWWIVAQNGIAAKFDERPVAFFPLLERSIKEQNQLYPISKTFPWDKLIEFAGASSSAHWQNLALQRIEEIGISDLSKATLEQLVDQGSSQQIRHRAKRLLKFIEK